MGQIIGKEYKSDEELQKDSRFWQDLLRLGNWNIRARLANPRDMEDSSSFGESRWRLYDYDTEIMVLAAGFNRGDHDQENTLAHEHVHLTVAPLAWTFRKVLEELAPAARGPLQAIFNNHMEQAIESLAAALVALKRQAEPKSE